MSDAGALGPPAFDAGRLIADLRRGDADALDEAYRRTFGGLMGRLVLGHFMALCGVGSTFGGVGVADGDLRYAAGRHDAAIQLAERAHFDQAAILAALATGELEGTDDDEPTFNYTPPLSDDDDF